MSDYNMGKLGVVAPFKAKEGSIAMDTVQTAHGDIKAPKLSAPINKGDWVELDGEMTVKKLTTSGVAIGIVANTPKWEIEPVTGYNQTQAVSADMLREAGIETIFKKIMTVNIKSGESAAAGKYLVPDDTTAGEFKLSSSSGTTATDIVCLTAQGTDDTLVAGFK